VETGKSDIKENLRKIKNADFDRIVLVATSPVAIAGCQKVIESLKQNETRKIQQYSWLDIS